MSQYEYDGEDFDFEVDDSELSGTDLVKKLRKQINAMNKALKEKDELLTDYQEVAYQNSVAETLTEWGLNPRIAAFVPDDIADEDELAAWLEEYGDAFATGSIQEEASDSGYAIDNDALQASELMADLEDGSFDPEIGLDMQHRMEQAQTPEELLSMLRG